MAVPKQGGYDNRSQWEWPPFLRGILIKRYQRFKADVELDTGQRVTAHCPNTGSMDGCCEPGRPVYLTRHDNPRRKLKYTWELIEMPASLVGINTGLPNRLVRRAIQAGVIPELSGYRRVIPEFTVGGGSRLDLLLENHAQDRCFVEIKNCTLVSGKTAFFPDAVTARGRKHLMALQDLIAAGHRGVMFYLVQRMDARRFRPALHIDPDYTRELQQARAVGLDVLAYDVRIDLQSIALNRSLEVDLSG